jgi:hypothetical protein
MYGLPEDFDASVFVGHDLEHIMFTSNTVFFSFGPELSVNTTSSFLYRKEALGSETKQVVPVGSSDVMSLLGKSVKVSRSDRSGMLELTFDDGQMLTFYDDQPSFESYSLRVGKREIFV